MSPRDYRHIEHRHLAGLIRWVEHAIPPGDFLKAVLENDLQESFARADNGSAAALCAIVTWIYNRAPMACHGSKEKTKAWKGLEPDEADLWRVTALQDTVMDATRT